MIVYSCHMANQLASDTLTHLYSIQLITSLPLHSSSGGYWSPWTWTPVVWCDMIISLYLCTTKNNPMCFFEFLISFTSSIKNRAWWDDFLMAIYPAVVNSIQHYIIHLRISKPDGLSLISLFIYVYPNIYK